MKVLVHSFNLGDVEDPEIYAAGPIWDWQQTEAGQWVMAHSRLEPIWDLGFNAHTYGYRVNIVAQLDEKDAIFYKLKYDHSNST